jgi:hypothetical protein
MNTLLNVGDIYNQVAGVDSHVYLVLYDSWGNRISTGSADIELALLGVGVEWGTILPYDTTPGLPNEYHYRGFYTTNNNYYSNIYGLVVDHQDGSYDITYNAPKAGEYVLRLALTQPGLNVTYFNNTLLGYLFNGDNSRSGIAAARGFPAINFGSSISWTGDVGGRPGAQGDRTLTGTYYDRFLTRVEPFVYLDLRYNVTRHRFMNDTDTAVHTKFNFREVYWSARWSGLITPEYAEEYVFTIEMDENSAVQVRIGGVGAMLNSTNLGTVVCDGANISRLTGVYQFTDARSREFTMDYVHYTEESFVALYWQSLSTPYSLVPASAYSHWRNISHYNTTIHPNALCSSCSTVYGEGLLHATAAEKASFTLYARDSFGNLLQTGGEVVSAFAVGRDGIVFRGDVTDYGNSTYLVEYIAVSAGDYLLYVTVGCCPPHPNVGVKGEIEQVGPLLVGGAPFPLQVSSANVNYGRSIVTGVGAVGGIAGTILRFTVSYRDIYNNPTSHIYDNSVLNNSEFVSVSFVDIAKGESVRAAVISYTAHAGSFVVDYNMTVAGTYAMSVTFKDMQTYAVTAVIGSPFVVVITSNAVWPSHTVLTGLGMMQATRNRTTAFRVQLFDRFKNAYRVGGTRLYVRLDGDARFSIKSLMVIPLCTDDRDGTLVCSYAPTVTGHHHLIVRVLQTAMPNSTDTSSVPLTGGSGLVGNYYVYSSPFPENFMVDESDSPTRPTFRGLILKSHFHGQTVMWFRSLLPKAQCYSIIYRLREHIQQLSGQDT